MFKPCLTLTFSARRLIVRYREIASAQAPERCPAEAAQTKAPALASERGRTQRAEAKAPRVLPLARVPRSGHGLGAGAPVAVSALEEGGLEADPLVRIFHCSFCALMNSR